MNKKILIFGPISNFGGRELEVGFLAKILSKNYIVDICSTGRITEQSQVYNFDSNQKTTTINKLVCKNYFWIKFFSIIGYLINGGKGNLYDFSSNFISHKYLNFKRRQAEIIDKLVVDYDLVLICGQFTSQYVSELVNVAKNNNIKIVFRTTGTIGNTNFDFINKIDLLIYHSVINSNRINNSNYAIIDQCAYSENTLLKIPISTKKISNFLVLSRLSPEKGIIQVIEFFILTRDIGDKLFISGNGSLEFYLIEKYKNLAYIIFTGFIHINELASLMIKIDCLIIPSPEESGPLVGVESMCAGKVIISTNVGAMSERLCSTANDFWYSFGDLDSFKKVYIKVKSLRCNEIESISHSLRTNYIKNYSNESIGNQYLKQINELL